MRRAADPLEPGEVRVVAIDLDAPPAGVAALAATLSPDERRRAERLAEPARSRWLVARGALRAIVAAQVGVEPQRLAWERSPRGRLELPGRSDPRFSLSRSGGRALVALARGRAVGVDIEAVRPVAHARDIAAGLMPPAQAQRLGALADDARDEEVVRWWARAEAYLKARGVGLAGLRPLMLAPSARLPARVTTGEGAAGVWAVQDLLDVPGCAAAVAARGDAWRATRSRWRADEGSGRR